jgi:hypothetical protein
MNVRATAIIYVLVHVVVFLIGLILVILGGRVFVAIGASLIAAGMAGWVIFVYILFARNKARSLQLLRDFGLERAYNERGPNIRDVYEPRLNDAEDSIDIMGFGLRTFREDFGHKFEDWAHTLEVRVLLIDPSYPGDGHRYADQRDLEEGDNPGRIRSDVNAFINETKDLINDPEANFEVRLYQCLPAMTVFRIDDEIFWGPYSVNDQSRNMPIFLISNRGEMHSYLLTHFNAVWDDGQLSRPVYEEWLE